MSKQEQNKKNVQVINPAYSFLPVEIEGFDSLAELALDMRWSWNHASDGLWHELDPSLWELTHNPWIVLQTVSRDQLEHMLADLAFRKKLDDLLQIKKQAAETPAWFQKNHAKSPLTCVAYFSMEFMLSEALPIYSGGLGNVAGDQLKAASDLGVPVVGIGLLYQQGYFRQAIDKDGSQQALFPYNDPGQLPVTPLRQINGEWLRLKIELSGYSIWLRTWQVQVGRVKLYLLDSNDAANIPVHRGITSELYGGGPELRLQQELVLGIGGWRLLSALGIRPEVCHLNEGHAAFAVLERALDFMNDSGQSFEIALAATRAGNIFTTHTAVEAGFDRFPPTLIEQYLGGYAKKKLGISISDLSALGRLNPADSSESFNMAYLAIRGCGSVNGVSRLHGKVSRQIISPLFPRWPVDEVPVGHVTNGVHIPSWDSQPADDLWTNACKKERWLGMSKTLEKDIMSVSDDKIWQMRIIARKSLIEYARERLSLQLVASGETQGAIDEAKLMFDPNILTLGFARRFASYKRPNLLLNDRQRFLRILTNSQFPVQLIIAGKAHPADLEGQSLISEWIHFIRQPEIRPHVIFLSDYDMLLTEHLVQGVDVWINTPRRPWEACGTSGMKVLVNGGINLSELDGWWAEAYKPELGWSIGDGLEHGADPNLDAVEANELYTILEKKVIPEFYSRNKKDIPTGWVEKMRKSMAQLTPQFSADRTVREYTEEHYLPSATAYVKRSAKKGFEARQIVEWQHSLDQKWTKLHFGETNIKTEGDHHIFEIQLYLNDVDPNSLKVELYADNVDGNDTVKQEMMQIHSIPDVKNGYIYHAQVSAKRPSADYSVRVIPFRDEVSIPLEVSQILWQR